MTARKIIAIAVVIVLAGCLAPKRKPLPIDPPKLVSHAKPRLRVPHVLRWGPPDSNFNLSWVCSNTTPDMVFEVRTATTVASTNVLTWPIITTVPANASVTNYVIGRVNDWLAMRLFSVTASNSTGHPDVVFNTRLVVTNITSTGGSWSRRYGGIATDIGEAVVVDPGGNIVVAGLFSDTVSFGGPPLTSAGGYDVFVAKYTPTGQHIWSIRFGGANSEVAKSVALDGAGNVYVSGTLLVGSLLKLNSSGTIIWTNGPASRADFSSIATDSQGNIIATGSFSGYFPLDFGNGHQIEAVNGSTDAFLAKYSPSGSNVWVQGFPNTGNSEVGTCVAVKRSDDTIFLTGYGYPFINLGGLNLSNGTPQFAVFGFLGKFNSAGTHLWSRSCGTIQTGGTYSRGRKVAVDSNGDAILSGEYQNKTDLGGQPMDSGSIILPGTANGWDMYLAKYSGTNGAIMWGQRTVGQLDCSPSGLAVDSFDNIFLSGTFRATVDFGGHGISGQSLTTTGLRDAYDIFTVRYSGLGAWVWSKKFGGTEGDYGYCLAVDFAGSPIVTGQFSGAATFGSDTLVSAGGFDVFLIKLNR